MELWPLLIEKAWAKLHGCYAVCASGSAGDTLQYLTAGPARKLEHADDSAGAWGQLRKLLPVTAHGSTRGNASFLTTSLEDDNVAAGEAFGLTGAHAYSLLVAAEVNGLRIVCLRNPWGSSKWSGRYGPSSREWTPQLKRALGVGARDFEHGAFCMDYTDFQRFFGTVDVCEPGILAALHAGADRGVIRTVSCCGTWERAACTAGGPPRGRGPDGSGPVPTTACDEMNTFWPWTDDVKQDGHNELPMDTFECNPRYRLTAKRGASVLVSLLQPDVRGAGKKKKQWMRMMLYEEKIASDGSAVSTELLFKVRDRSESLTITMEQDSIVLVPAAWGVGVEGCFYLMAAGANCRLERLGSPAPSPLQIHAMACWRWGVQHGLAAHEGCCQYCERSMATVSSYVLQDGCMLMRECKEGMRQVARLKRAGLCEWSGLKLPHKYVLIDGHSINPEFKQEFRESRADRCAHCGEAILGRYYTMPGGQEVHDTCCESFKRTRPGRHRR